MFDKECKQYTFARIKLFSLKDKHVLGWLVLVIEVILVMAVAELATTGL